MKGLHPALIRVIDKALAVSPIDFVVIEGLRTAERQQELFDLGASRIRGDARVPGRHLSGHAYDFAALHRGGVRWDWPLYKRIWAIKREIAEAEGVALQWGGNWRRFKDGPHIQLCRKAHPHTEEF